MLPTHPESFLPNSNDIIDQKKEKKRKKKVLPTSGSRPSPESISGEQFAIGRNRNILSTDDVYQ
jgi:hypothetical protein